jgi:putative transposase
MPRLTNDDCIRLLAESFDVAVKPQSYRLVAYVFVPEHVHLLVLPITLDVRMDLYLKALKAPFSTRIKRRLAEVESLLLAKLAVRELPGVCRFRFWQEGGGLRQESSIRTSRSSRHRLHPRKPSPPTPV